jgi:hypothetical protein
MTVHVPEGGVITVSPSATGTPALRDMGARWDQRSGVWTLSATTLNAQLANDAGLIPGGVCVDLRPPERVLDSRLYPFQARAAARMASAPKGQLVVLSPGLGKTATSIVAADLAVPDDRVVVVAPASLLDTWAREIAKWSTDPRVYIMRGKVDFDAAMQARWIIASWDKAVHEAKAWGKGWPLWVLDESVLAKSRSSKRAKVFAALRKNVERVWLLSGSPTTRHADDLWSQLHLIWPAAFASYWRFAQRYCFVEDTPWGPKVTGTRPDRDAAKDLEDLMIVVNQEDVLELPEYLFEPPLGVVLAGKQRAAYTSMRDSFVAELADGTEVVAQNEIARLMKLQQIASCFDGESAKRDALVSVLPSYEPPFLVWTHWRETAADLGVALDGAGMRARVVTGETKDKDTAIESYKAGKEDALILSLGVGKFGHTLTNTNTIVSFDRNFNADDYFQSMHRVRRIGLTHSPVVLPVVAERTVDEMTVGDNLEAKLAGIAKMTRGDLASLLKGMGR